MNGNPNLLYYNILLCVAMLAYTAVLPPLRTAIGFRIGALLVGLIVLVLVNSIELVPFFELQENISESRLHDDVSGWRMEGISWTQVASLVLPNMERAHWPYASNVGWIALMLALLSLGRLKTKDGHTVILMLVLVGLGILVLTRSPLLAAMWDYLPLFRRISMISAVFIFFVVPLSVMSGIGSRTLSRTPRFQILIALAIFFEIVASSNGWLQYSRIPRINSIDYVQEMDDFPHLAALNKSGVLKPYRIECRASSSRVLCPEYAIMHYRLRLVDGDKYLFPTERVTEVVFKQGQKTRLLDVRYILSPEELEEPGFTLREKVHWETFDEHGEHSIHVEIKKLIEDEEWDGTVYIYEASRNEHAFLVDDGFTGKVLPDDPIVFNVTDFSPMKVELEGYAPRSGTLFVSEPYYPGWKAKVDNASTDVRKLGAGFMGIPLEQGMHSIVLYYDPISFKSGLWITLVAVATVALASFFRMYPRGSAPPNQDSKPRFVFKMYGCITRNTLGALKRIVAAKDSI